MIVTYIAYKMGKLGRALQQHWLNAVTAPPQAPIPAWDDFSDMSLINVNQFPIIAYSGYEAIILDVVNARHGQPEMVNKLADKLQDLYEELRTNGPFESKWQILQMTSQQIHQLKDIASGHPPSAPDHPEPLSPYN